MFYMGAMIKVGSGTFQVFLNVLLNVPECTRFEDIYKAIVQAAHTKFISVHLART